MLRLSLIFAYLFLSFVSLPSNATTRTILVLGDSLSSGYGLSIDDGWVKLLQNKLSVLYPCYQIINVSRAGMTTQEGLQQTKNNAEKYSPNIAIIQLGGNDGLRGQAPGQIKNNLMSIIQRFQKHDTEILLIGIILPPNYGKAYTTAFQEAIALTAKETNVAFVPFLLDGFATKPDYFLADRIHPNKKAQPIILKTVYTELEPLLKRCITDNNAGNSMSSSSRSIR